MTMTGCLRKYKMTKANPLENVFDIEPGSTPIFHDLHPELAINTISERGSSLIDPTTGEVLSRSSDPNQDEIDREERIEDLEIDSQLTLIHNHAISAFEKSARMAEEVDPKFAARNAEVAAQYLNIALNAVNSRVDTKFKRQKTRLAMGAGSSPQSVHQNIIIADRNEILKQLLGKSDHVTIEVEDEAAS